MKITKMSPNHHASGVFSSNIFKLNISTNKIIKETLLSKPCYMNFYNVFLELKNKNYTNKNVLDIIEVYIKGYKCDKNYQIEDIYDIYIELTKSLNEIRVKNRNKGKCKWL